MASASASAKLISPGRRAVGVFMPGGWGVHARLSTSVGFIVAFKGATEAVIAEKRKIQIIKSGTEHNNCSKVVLTEAMGLVLVNDDTQ